MADGQVSAEMFQLVPCLREKARDIAKFLDARGSDESARAVRDRFVAFATWAQEVEFEQGRQVLKLPVDAADLVCYAEWLHHEGKAMSTISSYLSAIGTLHTAAGMLRPTDDIRVRDILTKLRMEHANDEPHRARSLTVSELARIVSKLHTPRNLRRWEIETTAEAHERASLDLAMLLTMTQAGMRRAEAVNLVWGDIREESDGSGRVVLPTTWSPSGETPVFISERCLRILKAIRPDDADDSSSVFNLSGSQIANRLKRMCKEAGIDPKNVSGHTPRATLRRLVMESGAPAGMIQWQLRLKQESLAQRYFENMDVSSALKWLHETFKATTEECTHQRETSLR